MGMSRYYIHTSLNCRVRSLSRIIPSLWRLKLPQILRLLHLPYSFFTSRYALKDIDIVLDAGGFQFGDQWKITDNAIKLWENYYRTLKKYGTKIILLPQAFGPFDTVNGRKIAFVVSKYADIIMAREQVSYNHLISAGVDENKVKLFPDFTALVEGIISPQFKLLRDAVCIIPNNKMIKMAASSRENYFNFLHKAIETIEKQGRTPFLLNHEGKGDAKCCKVINNQFDNQLTVVNNLNALEIKGVISQSYLVISSRFHGVASALNSGIPCLATSWSHKYAELFKDYNQKDCVLDLNNIDESISKIETFLSEKIHNEISDSLKIAKKSIIEKNKEMWEEVLWKK
jgi:colanic acid/amylovoran biosynthesis protein